MVEGIDIDLLRKKGFEISRMDDRCILARIRNGYSIEIYIDEEAALVIIENGSTIVEQNDITTIDEIQECFDFAGVEIQLNNHKNNRNMNLLKKIYLELQRLNSNLQQANKPEEPKPVVQEEPTPVVHMVNPVIPEESINPVEASASVEVEKPNREIPLAERPYVSRQILTRLDNVSTHCGVKMNDIRIACGKLNIAYQHIGKHDFIASADVNKIIDYFRARR